jgi:DNA-binding beta-propeller fold protein YncE
LGRDGSTLYVGAFDWGFKHSFATVSVVDTKSLSVRRRFDVGRWLNGLAPNADDSMLYAPHWEGGTVWVVDTAHGLTKSRIEVERAPVYVALAPGGSPLLVSNRNSDTVSIVDLKAEAEVEEVF